MNVFYTDRQVAILEFLQRYRRMRNSSPTLEEMAEAFGVSKVTIHDHVRQLEKKGAVRKIPHKARALEILDPEYRDQSTGERSELRLPLLGRIAAGEPIEALESEESIDLAELVPLGGDHYGLEVSGDSMVDDGIRDGDLVIVERRNVADDGEVVVAILDDNEATLKRLYRERNGQGERYYRLQPANDTMAPILTKNLEIRGVVVGVVRRFS